MEEAKLSKETTREEKRESSPISNRPDQRLCHNF